MIQTSAFEVASTYIGLKEIPGSMDDPAIMAMLQLDNSWPQHDEIPWCSAFANQVAHLLHLERSRSLAARSWLRVGELIVLDDARPEEDIVILKRGGPGQPGPEVIKAPGHVGFYASHDETTIEVLGGNQSDGVRISRYPKSRILQVRRLRRIAA